jgi:hypothetical protein
MLLIAAFGALVTFLLAIELSRGATGAPAFAALALFCVSPLFFAQAMLAQLDMPAMCLSLLALLLYLQNRIRASAIACGVLVLFKETGLVVPIVLGFWALLDRRDRRRDFTQALWFLLPLPGLLVWLMVLHYATGHWLGNSQFTAYNLFEPLHPVTFLLAFARRVYYLFIGSGHFIGTIALIWAYRRMPLLRDRPWKIAGSFVLAQMVAVSALGGAVLERYLLPALPIVYIAFAVSLRALFPKMRHLALGALMLCLAASNFINPLYPFPFENNLAFASFVNLEEQATDAVSTASLALPGGGRVATVFPVADALRNPDFGFVQRGRSADTIADFSRSEVEKLRDRAPDLVVFYRREWDPMHLLERPAVRDFLMRHYGYKPELTAVEVADVLSMRVARRWEERGLSMYLLAR